MPVGEELFDVQLKPIQLLQFDAGVLGGHSTHRTKQGPREIERPADLLTNNMSPAAVVNPHRRRQGAIAVKNPTGSLQPVRLFGQQGLHGA